MDFLTIYLVLLFVILVPLNISLLVWLRMKYKKPLSKVYSTKEGRSELARFMDFLTALHIVIIAFLPILMAVVCDILRFKDG